MIRVYKKTTATKSPEAEPQSDREPVISIEDRWVVVDESKDPELIDGVHIQKSWHNEQSSGLDLVLFGKKWGIQISSEINESSLRQVEGELLVRPGVKFTNVRCFSPEYRELRLELEADEVEMLILRDGKPHTALVITRTWEPATEVPRSWQPATFDPLDPDA